MKLLKKYLSFSMGSVVAVAISVVLLPILTRIISPEEFGYATIFLNVGLVLSVVGLAGVDQAFMRFFHGSNRRNLFIKAVMFSLVITLLLGVFLFLFDGKLSALISPGNSYALLMFFYVSCFILARFANLILRMQQLAIRYSIIEVTKKVCDFLFVISFALLFVPNHYSLILGYSFSLLIAGIISLCLSIRFWQNPEAEDSKTISYKEIFTYSFPFMFAGLLAILLQTLDKLLLGYWGTAEELGIYSATFKLVALINIVQHTFTLFWTPVYLEHYKKTPEDKELYGRVARLMTIIMVSLCVAVILFKDVLVLFLGPDYQKASAIMAALVLMPAFMTMSETTMIGINLKLKPKFHMLISSIVLAVALSSSYFLIPALGLEGAALTVGISYFSLYILRTVIGQKLFGFDIKFKETFTILGMLLLWVASIVLYSDQLGILFSGAFVILVSLVIFFFDDIKSSSKVVTTSLKTYKTAKSN